jgi:hypothetical protein
MIKTESVINLYSVLPIRCIKDDDEYINKLNNLKKNNENQSSAIISNKPINNKSEISWQQCVEKMKDDSYLILIDKKNNKPLGFAKDQQEAEKIKTNFTNKEILIKLENIKFAYTNNLLTTFYNHKDDAPEEFLIILRRDGSFISNSKFRRGNYKCEGNENISLLNKEVGINYTEENIKEWQKCVEEMKDDSYLILIDKKSSKPVGFAKDQQEAERIKSNFTGREIIVKIENIKFAYVNYKLTTFYNHKDDAPEEFIIILRNDGSFISDSNFKRGQYSCNNQNIFFQNKEIQLQD